MIWRQDRKFQKILELDNEVEARLLASILKERDIPHVVRSYHDSVYNGLWQQQMGWGHIEAPLRFKEEIEIIYRDLQTNQDQGE